MGLSEALGLKGVPFVARMYVLYCIVLYCIVCMHACTYAYVYVYVYYVSGYIYIYTYRNYPI